MYPRHSYYLLVWQLAFCWPVFAQSPANSWPQWGGLNRDHKSQATGLLQDWPKGGPKQIWKFDQAGVGYSSISVVDGKAFTLGTINEQNCAICIDVNSGKQLWLREIAPAVPREAYNQDWAGGPRSTPTVVGDKVLVLDDGGTLACLKTDSGEVIWKVNLVSDFGGIIPRWGYSESPLVDGQRVIVCPGGDEFLVALDLMTGKKMMASSGYSQGVHYVSVVKTKVGETEMYVTACQAGLVGFGAKSGKALWTNSRSGNGTATIPTPVVFDNYVYHTSDYGTGCVLVQLEETNDGVRANEIYANQFMQNHHGGVVLVEGNIFGFKKGGGWICQDFIKGDVKWTTRIEGDPSVSVAFADQRLYLFGEQTGTCYLVEPSAEKYIEHGQFTLAEKTKIDRKRGKIWAHPVIAEGKLFLRDMDLIFAYDITK